MSLFKISKAVRPSRILNKTAFQSRALHYTPSESRVRESVKEPQTLEHFYAYRYMPDFYPEILGEARYIPTNPYQSSTMYDWDNYMPEEQNEQFSYAPVWAYLTFGLSYLWFALYILYSDIEADHNNYKRFEFTDIAGGSGNYAATL